MGGLSFFLLLSWLFCSRLSVCSWKAKAQPPVHGGDTSAVNACCPRYMSLRKVTFRVVVVSCRILSDKSKVASRHVRPLSSHVLLLSTSAETLCFASVLVMS